MNQEFSVNVRINDLRSFIPLLKNLGSRESRDAMSDGVHVVAQGKRVLLVGMDRKVLLVLNVSKDIYTNFHETEFTIPSALILKLKKPKKANMQCRIVFVDGRVKIYFAESEPCLEGESLEVEGLHFPPWERVVPMGNFERLGVSSAPLSGFKRIGECLEFLGCEHPRLAFYGREGGNIVARVLGFGNVLAVLAPGLRDDMPRNFDSCEWMGEEYSEKALKELLS